MKDFKNEIKEIVQECSDITAAELERLSEDSNLKDFGIDSLSLVEVIYMIEDKYNIVIDPEDIDDVVKPFHNMSISINVLNEILNKKIVK